LRLVFLLVVISITVMESSPKPYNSEQKQRILEAHEAILYFIDAEIMAKRLFPDPSARWSHYILDGGSGCRTHDNKYWLAYGTVEIQPNLLPQRLSWAVCFVPGDQAPVFVRVGDMQSGDLTAALRMTSDPEASKKGAADEK